MPRSRSNYSIGPVFLIATTLIVTAILAWLAPADAAEATPSSGKGNTTIYRCVMKDGSIAYADRRCEGASTVTPWRAPEIPKGLRRTEGGGNKERDVRSAYREDPYVACKHDGGQFLVSSRICRLPAGAAISAVTQ